MSGFCSSLNTLCDEERGTVGQSVRECECENWEKSTFVRSFQVFLPNVATGKMWIEQMGRTEVRSLREKGWMDVRCGRAIRFSTTIFCFNHSVK